MKPKTTINLWAGLVLCAVFILGGCASKPGSYVVLLPSPDGTVGKIVLENEKGIQTLDAAQTGISLDGRGPSFAVGQAQLDRDFKSSIQARPPLPEQFMLFFELGNVELMPDSRTLLMQILERARARSTVDISVIGHTDTMGESAANEVLARDRAETIAAQLRRLDLQNLVIAVDSHGEKNLLVPTPDGVAEARNRRVEITIR